MDGFSQDDRTLKIDSPLGANALLVEGFGGDEYLSQLFSFTATVLPVVSGLTDPSTVRAALVSKKVTVQLRLREGEYRPFNGMVSKVTATDPAHDGSRQYLVEMVPWLWFLQKTSDCRIFQNQAVPDILKTIFGELGYSDYDFSKLTKTCKPREYCVQYHETDLAFIERLLAEEGIYYWFQHETGRHVLMLGYQTAPYQQGTEVQLPYSIGSAGTNHVTSWMHNSAYGATSTTVGGAFNYQVASTPQSTTPLLGGSGQNAEHEMFDYRRKASTPDEAKDAATLLMQAEEAGLDVVTGTGRCRSLAPTGKFNLQNGPEGTDGKAYVVRSMHHHTIVQQGGSINYFNTFTCMLATTPFVPFPAPQKPLVTGYQTATVVGPAGQEIYTDNFGRVKVQFHWDRRGKSNEHSSCFMRVMQGAAGAGTGAQTVPRMGTEVVIMFENGDPDWPMVVGAVPNAGTMPPDALPDNKTRHVQHHATTPKNGQHSEFSIETKAGCEEMAFNTPGDMSVAVANNIFENAGNTSVRSAANAMSLSCGEEASKIELQPDSVVLYSNGSRIVLMQDQIRLESNGSVVVLCQAGITVNGQKVWLNC